MNKEYKNKIFIDCGANEGQSIDNFIKKWTDWKEYSIISFEADPRLMKSFDRFSNLENVEINNTAVWIYDGTVNFYQCQDGKVSSSIIGTKRTGRLSNIPISVNCIDLAKLILNIKNASNIILKIDIEGGEYDLLEHMLKTNVFEYIHELYIEFHEGKVNKTINDNIYLLNQLKSYTNLKVYHDTWQEFNFV